MATIKILMVEDDLHVSRLYEEELKEAGYEVDLATSGTKAIQLFKNRKYDIVTLDLYLPDIDGKEVLKEMKSYNKNVPIIIISAFDRRDDFYLWAADGYVVKSSNLEEMKDTIKSVLNKEYVELKLRIGKIYFENFSKLYNQDKEGVIEKLENILEHAIRSYLTSLIDEREQQ